MLILTTNEVRELISNHIAEAHATAGTDVSNVASQILFQAVRDGHIPASSPDAHEAVMIEIINFGGVRGHMAGNQHAFNFRHNVRLGD